MRPCYLFRARDKTVELGKITRVMGVVNLTPDSFSDGGRFLDRSRACARCLELVEAGADMLDLGGESSRPGAEPVPAQAELERVAPVLESIRKEVAIPISVDTRKAEVAREVLRQGADIINDISAFRWDREMPAAVREWRAGVVLMHMRGNPLNMQELPASGDILREIREDLRVAVSKAVDHEIRRDHILIDPGIGFGKGLQENCRILNQLSFLDDFRLPVMVGTSRKSFLGKIVGKPVNERLCGSLASAVAAIMRGAHVIRVHDVPETVQAARVADAIAGEGLRRE